MKYGAYDSRTEEYGQIYIGIDMSFEESKA